MTFTADSTLNTWLHYAYYIQSETWLGYCDMVQSMVIPILCWWMSNFIRSIPYVSHSMEQKWDELFFWALFVYRILPPEITLRNKIYYKDITCILFHSWFNRCHYRGDTSSPWINMSQNLRSKGLNLLTLSTYEWQQNNVMLDLI